MIDSPKLQTPRERIEMLQGSLKETQSERETYRNAWNRAEEFLKQAQEELAEARQQIETLRAALTEARARFEGIEMACARGTWYQISSAAHIGRQEIDSIPLTEFIRNSQALATVSASAWQEIETAPKNVPVLGFDGNHIHMVYWDSYSHGGEWFTCDELRIKPTHWQPLPAPPQVTP